MVPLHDYLILSAVVFAIGVIGVETFYGRITGSYRVLDALTTLSFYYPDIGNDRSDFRITSYNVCYTKLLRTHRPRRARRRPAGPGRHRRRNNFV